MNVWNFIKSILGIKDSGFYYERRVVIEGTGYKKDTLNMQIIENRQLTPHLSIFEMTRTDKIDLQMKNRNISDGILECLTVTAQKMEQVRTLTGNLGINVHSAYRCPELNGDIPGASPTSQHPKGQACDFDVECQAVEETFEILKKALKEGKFWCGQLIMEIRGNSKWIHVSLPDPWRDILRCGQIMISPKAGVFELLEQIKKP